MNGFWRYRDIVPPRQGTSLPRHLFAGTPWEREANFPNPPMLLRPPVPPDDEYLSYQQPDEYGHYESDLPMVW
jgi:hypothetical protein